MSEKHSVPVDIERVSRIFNKIMKVLQKKTKSSIETLMAMKFGVAFFEISLGVESSDDSEIRAFVKAMMEEASSGMQKEKKA